MHYVEQKYGDVLVLAVKGKLSSTPETENIHEKINGYIQENIKNIILDLKHVHRISSMGIGSIMRCMMTVRTEGGDLRLTGLSDKIKDILSITQLVGIIKVYDTIKDAVDSFDET